MSDKESKRVAEQLNGRLAMLGIVACIGAYLTTGQIILSRIDVRVICTHEISPFMAILWCFYPIGILVFFELLMGSQDDDDDDQGGGIMTPVYQGT